MSKFLKVLMPLLIAVVAFGAPLAARADGITPVPDTTMMNPSSGSIFRGQEHNYAVTFRGNGEAIVYANIVFTNTTDNTINEFVFTAPVQIQDLTIFQYKANLCNYGYLYDGTTGVCSYSKTTGTPYDQSMYPYYGTGQNAYIKAKFTAVGNKVTIKLPIDVKVDDKGYLLLGFTSKQFATESFGSFSYKFTTLQVEQRIEKVHVGVNVDSDLILKDAASTVNYANDVSMSSAGAGATSEKAVPNTDFDTLISNITYSGSISKTFSGLAISETVDVTGEYAANAFRLYAKEISITVAIVIVVVIGIALLVRKYAKRKKDAIENKTQTVTASSFVIDVVIGLVSAILTIALTMGISALSYYTSIGYYGYGYMSSIVQVIVAILIVLVYAVLLLLGAAIRGTKYGWKSFLTVLLSEIVFLAIIGIFIFAIIFAQSRVYSTPYMM